MIVNSVLKYALFIIGGDVDKFAKKYGLDFQREVCKCNHCEAEVSLNLAFVLNGAHGIATHCNNCDNVGPPYIMLLDDLPKLASFRCEMCEKVLPEHSHPSRRFCDSCRKKRRKK
jgi:Zn finger protein HypA/HybF involved in hydrogenase expression